MIKSVDAERHTYDVEMLVRSYMRSCFLRQLSHGGPFMERLQRALFRSQFNLFAVYLTREAPSVIEHRHCTGRKRNNETRETHCNCLETNMHTVLRTAPDLQSCTKKEWDLLQNDLLELVGHNNIGWLQWTVQARTSKSTNFGKATTAPFIQGTKINFIVL